MVPFDLWLGLAMASVLNLRREMIVADPVETEPAALAPADDGAAHAGGSAVADADTADEQAEDAHLTEDDDHRGPTFMGRLTLIGGIAAGIAALAAYPAMIVMESRTGESRLVASSENSGWTAPWAGAAAELMEIHIDDGGWAADAPDWAPAARLTAKPALQSALAESLGEFLALKSREAAAAGARDGDLEAAARLLTGASTGVQVRAAFEALVSHDQRARRYAATAAAPDGDSVAELALIAQWARRSQAELAKVAGQAGGVLDADATRAVYSAKGRAQAAYMLLQAIGVHDDRLLEARLGATEAWRAVARFDPLIVLNAAPDSPVLGNHAASVGFLMTQAEAATTSYRAAAARVSPAPAPGVTNVVSAGILATDSLR